MAWCAHSTSVLRRLFLLLVELERWMTSSASDLPRETALGVGLPQFGQIITNGRACLIQVIIYVGAATGAPARQVEQYYELAGESQKAVLVRKVQRNPRQYAKGLANDVGHYAEIPLQLREIFGRGSPDGFVQGGQ